MRSDFNQSFIRNIVILEQHRNSISTALHFINEKSKSNSFCDSFFICKCFKQVENHTHILFWLKLYQKL